MLQGQKVLLRAIEREDLKRLHELGRNVEIVVLGDGAWRPMSLASYEKDFDKYLEEDREKSWFAIEADGKLIGDCGLHSSDRRAGATAFGIAIYEPEYLGRGYGRDAIALLLDYAFRLQSWRRVWLQTWASNERAIRAYGACGFVEEGRLRQHIYVDGQYVDEVQMGLLRDEWRRSKDAGVR